MQKEYVRTLFNSIAHKYDFLNHVLSGGIDFYWRRKAINQLFSSNPKIILDIAAGTADFSLAAMRLQPAKIIGIDISQEMLEIGKKKVEKKKLSNIITLQLGEAENLQFENNFFDAVIVAFGVRNFENLEKGLSEIYRVLKSNGKIIVLEFSRPTIFPLKQLYFFYFQKMLPLVGKIISKNNEAYQYLPDTVMKFPDGENFLGKLRELQFSSVSQQRLTFGIVTIYSGTRP